MSSYPPGLTTATIKVGSVVDFFGDMAAVTVEVTPVLGGKATHIVHAATGTAMVPATRTFESDIETGLAEFELPHTDAPGWLDAAGREVRFWKYAVNVTATLDNGFGKALKWSKDVQPLVGQTVIDLELVPSGDAADTIAIPPAAVLSINGQTGHVTVSDLGGDAYDDTVLRARVSTLETKTASMVTSVNGQTGAVTVAAGGTTPFVLLLPTDPVPAGLPEGTIIVRATATTGGGVTEPPAAATVTISGHLDSQDTSLTPEMNVSVVPNGSWMVLVQARYDEGTISAPAGWVELFTPAVAGTLRLIAWAKIKTSTDTTVPFGNGIGSGHSTTVIYGTGAGAVANWVVGGPATRASNATATTTVAPAITPPAGTLTLAFSGERTSAAEATEPTTNATKLFYMGQGTNPTFIETLMVSRVTNPAVPTTVTYPNSQTNNGIAFTLGVTPSV